METHITDVFARDDHQQVMQLSHLRLLQVAVRQFAVFIILL